MSMRTVLVAGATGIVGRELTRLLHDQGYAVRAFSRNPARAQTLRGLADAVVTGDATKAHTLRGVANGVDAVISCLGAPVSFTWADRRGFHAVDTQANGNLIRAARDAGVSRFVYVAVHAQPAYAETAYVRAHEAVVDELSRSELSFSIVRPTGLFPIFEPLLAMARYGIVAIPGDGTARTNPMHPLDVARACIEALDAERGTSWSVGGPDVFSRDEIVELAFQTVHKTPRIVHAPRSLAVVAGAALRPLHPRTGELIDFAARVFTSDCVAPRYGEHRLADYFVRVRSMRQ